MAELAESGLETDKERVEAELEVLESIYGAAFTTSTPSSSSGMLRCRLELSAFALTVSIPPTYPSTSPLLEPRARP